MRQLRTMALAAVLAVSASLLVAPPASAEPSWVDPELLGADARYFDMDVNASGAAVAVWNGGGAIKASYRPAGQDWSRPVQLGRVGDGTIPGTPLRAFVDEQGRAAVVASGPEAETILVVTRSVNGTWRRDEHAPSVGGGCCWTSTPTADMDGQGNLVLTWVESNDQVGDSTSIAWRRPSGRWSVVSGGGGYLDLVAHHETVTMARGGEGVFVQTASLGEAASQWRRVRPGVNVGWRPVLAGNTAGDLVLATVENDDPDSVINAGDPGRLVVMTKAAGGAWVDASAAAPVQQVGFPSVSIGADGEIVVSYRRASGGGVEVVTGRAGEADLTAPVALAETSGRAAASVAITPAAGVMVSWSADDAGTVEAALRSNLGSWTSLGWLGGDILGGQLTQAYPNGMFTVLHLDDDALWWSDYVDDTTGPSVHMLAPRRSFNTRTSIQVRWALRDELARPKNADVRVRKTSPDRAYRSTEVWKRRETQKSGRYPGRPGWTYCFSARGRDRVGNLGGWSDERCLTTPIDDRSFATTTGWRRVQQRASYRNTLTATNRRGTMRRSGVPATTLRLLAQTCPSCGRIKVTHGGRALGTFDLQSPKTRKSVLLLTNYNQRRKGALVLTVVSRGKPVRIDGLIATP